MKRGIDNVRLPSRPYRFEFESNEDEERAIAEAIANEEEKMRLEEESNRARLTGFHISRPLRLNSPLTQAALFENLQKQPIHFSRNLMPQKDDDQDTVCIKQMLDSLITQVCRWDKTHGWFKNLQRKPRTRIELDRLRQRRMFSNQRELLMADHVDRLRKEINKRRTKLENLAEEECGLVTPWRRSKLKPTSKNQSNVSKKAATSKQRAASPEVRKALNPAEISLGGDSMQWSEAERKPIDKLEVKDDEELVEDRSRSPPKRRKPENVAPPPPTEPDDWQKRKSVKMEVLSGDEADRPRRGRPPKERLNLKDEITSASDSDVTVPRPPPTGMDPTAVHCLCRKAYNPKKFYLMCDSCSLWFHGKCVGVSERKAVTMKGFKCPVCTDEEDRNRQEQQVQLYCVCQTSYDETRFYVGCDRCEDWFHPECVNITQGEAESMSEYICPTCMEQMKIDNEQVVYEEEVLADDMEDMEDDEEPGSSQSYDSNCPPLTRADYPLVLGMMEQLRAHSLAGPFSEPMDIETQYAHLIKQPIDFTMIQQRLECLEYQHLREVERDVLLTLENAKLVHSKESEMYKAAVKLGSDFEQLLLETQAAMDNRMQLDMRKASECRMDSSLDIDTDQLIGTNLDMDQSMYADLIGFST